MEHADAVAIFTSLFLVFFLFRGISTARRKKNSYIRRIKGIDAIDMAIGRAAELGRPISFTTGITSVNPVLFACLGTLGYIAKKSSHYKSRLLVPLSDPEVLPLTEITIQNAYQKEDKLNLYNPENLVYLSSEQFAYASGYMGLVSRENVGSAFLFGSFAAESLILAEAGQNIGAMQIAATTSGEQVAFFLTACDYTLIGEELFASGAYLSDDPVQKGSLRAQDLTKLLIVVAIVVGCADVTVGSFFDGYTPMRFVYDNYYHHAVLFVAGLAIIALSFLEDSTNELSNNAR